MDELAGIDVLIVFDHGFEVDEEAVVDGNLVSGRNPDDIAAFDRRTIRLSGGHT